MSGNVVWFAGGGAIRFPAGSRMVVTLYALPHGVTPPPAAAAVGRAELGSGPDALARAVADILGQPRRDADSRAHPGPVLLGTTTMTFTTTGARQTSSVAQANGSGSYTVGSSNPSVATASVSVRS